MAWDKSELTPQKCQADYPYKSIQSLLFVSAFGLGVLSVLKKNHAIGWAGVGCFVVGGVIMGYDEANFHSACADLYNDMAAKIVSGEEVVL